MLAKVKALIRVEIEHTAKDRALQQWQLLFTIDDVQYIVGKGGVNTMFYQIGKAERVLCFPDELIAMIESYLKMEYTSYSIYSPEKEKLISGLPTIDAAKKKKAAVGCYIVGHADGKRFRLFTRKLSMYKEPMWMPFVKKPTE